MSNNIPKNWEKVKLKKYIDIIRGVNYKSNEAFENKKNNTTGILRANNISNDGILNFEKILYIDNKNIKNEQLIKEGDIIVAMSSGSRDLVGKAAQAKKNYNYAFGAFCGVIRPKNINSKLLGYYFLTDYYRNKISKLSTGININNLRKEHLENLDIMLPINEKEQQEIVQVLDTMSDIIRLRKECIKHAQDLIPALFQEMFGDINNNVTKSNIVRFRDCIELNPAKPNLKDNLNVTFLGMKDISENGQVDLLTIKMYEEVKKGFTNFENEDVLLAKITPCFENGKAAIARNLTNGYGFGSTEFYVLRSNQKLILPEYVYSIIKSYSFAEHGKYKMAGAAGQKRLPKEYVLNYRFPLPSIELQEQFAQKAIEIENYIKEQQEELKNAEQMFQSLLHHAFTGKLTSLTRVDLLTKQLVLHAKIINKCNTQPTFGAVKLEKIFNLCDMIQELNLVPNGYYRKAAGPYVPEMRHIVEQELLQNNWVKITNQGNGKKVEYKKDTNFVAYKAVYNQIFNNKNQGIERIINYFYDKDTNYCEAFSTLYMCWNDLILEGKSPTRTEIIDEFKNHWAPEKQRFERIYLLKILSDMSNQGFEPQGHGVHTIESNYNYNKDQLNLQLK